MKYWFDRKHHEFKPFTVTIEIETLEDANGLCHALDTDKSYKYDLMTLAKIRDLRNYIHCTANNLNGDWFNVNK